jgi:hypothetical protein
LNDGVDKRIIQNTGDANFWVAWIGGMPFIAWLEDLANVFARPSRKAEVSFTSNGIKISHRKGWKNSCRKADKDCISTAPMKMFLCKDSQLDRIRAMPNERYWFCGRDDRVYIEFSNLEIGKV